MTKSLSQNQKTPTPNPSSATANLRPEDGGGRFGIGSEHRSPSLWRLMLLAAMAGGMGWGIRGQYGHETGAMIAGVLVGLVFVLKFCTHTTSLFAARAVAMCAIGVSIGGSMTYGQTLGLTQDPELVGNIEALRWGMLGVFIKGAIWIGFAAAFLGMSLGGMRYRPVELAILLVVMLFLYFLGVELLNSPFDPPNKLLPAIYFSDAWYWEPGADLEPRREMWGGLLVALAGLYVYTAWFRGDRLVRWLTLWGVLAGGLGFSLGQCVQAFHAWNLDWIRQGSFAEWDPLINWWNMMETTFGAIFGAVLALGLWLNRRQIREPDDAPVVEWTPSVEWSLAIVHVMSLVAWNFGNFEQFDLFADLAITMVLIPVIAVGAGRLWPYLVTLPMVAIPIAGKTLRDLCYRADQMPVNAGWIVYVVLPVLLMTIAAVVLARSATKAGSAHNFARASLLLATWLYFGLNFAFFRFPWPWSEWSEWTSRTPNGIIFAICALGLTAAAIFARKACTSDTQANLRG